MSESGGGTLRKDLQGEILLGMRCFSTEGSVQRPHFLFCSSIFRRGSAKQNINGF